MLCWNVYVGDFNSGKIELFNVFNHYGFYRDCVKAKKQFKDDKGGFAEEIRRSLAYYYWSKCEWEVILEHWPSGELYEMRKKMKIGELRKALQGVGIEYDDHSLYRAKDETGIEIRVFPQNNRYKDQKIDVYEQVMNNWDVFVDYVWEHRKELKERK